MCRRSIDQEHHLHQHFKSILGFDRSVCDTLCLGCFRSGLTNPSCKSSGEIDCAGQWAFDVLILTPRWCDTNLCGYEDDMRQNAIGWRRADACLYACFLPTKNIPSYSYGLWWAFSSNFIFWGVQRGFSHILGTEFARAHWKSWIQQLSMYMYDFVK